MNRNDFSGELETKIRSALAAPQASPEFKRDLRDLIYQEGKKMDIKPTKSKKRIAWVSAFASLAIIFLILSFTSPKFVEAMRRIFGFLPGVGLVESSSFKVLDKKVTLEREGITLSVTEAAADMDKTVFLVEVSGFGDYSTPDTVDTIGVAGEMDPFLALPDGNILSISFGAHMSGGDGTGNMYKYQYTFPSLPEDVMEVSLGIPRLLPIPPGEGPENWLIPIKFKAGNPEELARVFDVDIQDGGGVQEGDSDNAETPESPIPSGYEQIVSSINYVLDKVVDLDSGYIFMTKMTWGSEQVPAWGVFPMFKGIFEDNGNEIPYEFAQPEKMPGQGEKAFYNAYQVNGKDFAWPLKLAVESIGYDLNTDLVFQFDPGPDPQVGQIWQVNKEIVVDPYSFVIDKVEAFQADDHTVGFRFFMHSDFNVMRVHLMDMNNPVMGGGGGGGAEIPSCSEVFDFESDFLYMEFPDSPIEVSITNLHVCIPGDWQVSWQPQ